MSLQNRTILITRQPDQAGSLVSEVERRGGRAVVVPMIRIVPPDSWEACDSSISRLGTYNAIVFTSTNAVEKFFDRCRQRGLSNPPGPSGRIFAVGPATAKKIGEYGLRVEDIPDRFTSSDLAALLSRSDVRGLNILIPRGNIARGEVARSLRESGARVDDVVVYGTAGPDPLQTASLGRRLGNREFDAVTFASPSAVKNFSAILPGDLLRGLPQYTAIAVIGPTTQKAVEEAGLKADIVAAEATAHGLVEAIAGYFSKNNGVS